MVADDVAAGAAHGRRWPASGEYVHDPADAVGGRVQLAAESDLVHDRDVAAQTEHGVGGHGHRPRRIPQKELIELAYRVGEALGLALWCQDEAGPYQAIPQPGPAWCPSGEPVRLPHEHVRGGTAKLLTLFRPATGEVRATPVLSAPNVVLHPWLKEQLTAILADLPAAPAAASDRAAWTAWQAGLSAPFTLPDILPPLRMLLVLDNLVGHKTPELVLWLVGHGVMPLYTPIAGSWLNMVESLQRILAGRALAGQHPESAEQVMEWLAATVRGWNAAPTQFEWGGHRATRRARAHARRHTLGGSGACTHHPVPRHNPTALATGNGYEHDK